jgi:hypothetical protein
LGGIKEGLARNEQHGFGVEHETAGSWLSQNPRWFRRQAFASLSTGSGRNGRRAGIIRFYQPTINQVDRAELIADEHLCRRLCALAARVKRR